MKYVFQILYWVFEKKFNILIILSQFLIITGDISILHSLNHFPKSLENWKDKDEHRRYNEYVG